MAVVDSEIAENLRFVPTEVITLGRPVSALDAIRVNDPIVAFYGVQLRERLATREGLIANQIGRVTLTEVIGLLGRIYPAWDARLVDGVGIAQTQALQRAASIIEALNLSESLQGAARYHLTVAQGLKLTVSLGNFFGVSVLDGLALDDDLFARVLAFANLTEGVGVAAVLRPQLLLNVVLDESIDLTPEMALRMLFKPTLSEGIELTAGMLEPNGAFTTWVMNTRSGAVTEYSNFTFNSFAPVGNRYLGASEDGLFELLGDDDDGEDIIARIKSGYLQFGGTQLSRLKEAYIAQDGEQRMILRIRTKDDQLYNYGVDTRDGRSTKVHMGKGQRSRYFAFELISTGPDFTLDTLEFVPIVVARRV